MREGFVGELVDERHSYHRRVYSLRIKDAGVEAEPCGWAPNEPQARCHLTPFPSPVCESSTRADTPGAPGPAQLGYRAGMEVGRARVARVLHRLPRSAEICRAVARKPLKEIEGGPTNPLPSTINVFNG